MLAPTPRRLTALAATALLATALASPALAAGPVTVQVNGNTLNLNPAPTERAGRVFVPLRGIFENLGASVVYQGGVINATGRGHNVSLRIGSQQATVDGQQQTIDVAPFIIGASTYVPLRFVSQALGATVNYDGANRIVAISASGVQAAQNPPAANQAPPPANNGNQSPVRLSNPLPVRGATIQGNRTTVQATFTGGTVDANTVHVNFDGRDVTSRAYISDKGITYTTPVLPATQHTVHVTGKDTAGASFDRSWSFTTGGGADVSNTITNVAPAANTTVPSSFTVRGHTRPGSQVTVQVGVAQQAATNIGQVIGAIFGANGSAPGVQANVQADANGDFAVPVSINAPSGSVLGVVITATEPNYGVAATPVKFNLRVQ